MSGKHIALTVIRGVITVRHRLQQCFLSISCSAVGIFLLFSFKFFLHIITASFHCRRLQHVYFFFS
ncbi:hypothetical protein FQN60_009976 [Etheostoma spectabile]|uniref:Uncharacterized protein n=1 Tax=Etheostoma spectabile TaxID=54343 RepID=A0A5J5DAE6_9PERO|nr:hypothetical protein FQN60_009976 [Etheostoma spectabile]